MRTEVELLEARLKAGSGDPKHSLTSAKHIKDSLKDAALVGDLAALNARVDYVLAKAQEAVESVKHARDEARQAGFTRFTKCFRHQNSGEHPKGRACDFSAHKGTFGGAATGADRTYGNRLADFFISNSSGLGVLYVIWYRRIWLPSSGWKSYSGAGGDPSSDHTNHVHLSVN